MPGMPDIEMPDLKMPSFGFGGDKDEEKEGENVEKEGTQLPEMPDMPDMKLDMKLPSFGFGGGGDGDPAEGEDDAEADGGMFGKIGGFGGGLMDGMKDFGKDSKDQ